MDKILLFLKITATQLKTRPNMFFSDCTKELSSYLTFFEGIFYTIHQTNHIHIERKISAWYQNKVKDKAPNLVWTFQFSYENKNMSEEESIQLFLDTIIQFTEEYKHNTQIKHE